MPRTKKPENKIWKLSESLTNKIAAGEVVDRPASVVKELVENAIDARADDITIILKNGGKSLIQVVDNGTGMSQDDALLAFQRHSTSKIRSFDDIEKLTTLGFRGEALASISSVSRIELRSVEQNAIEGTFIQLEGGKVQQVGVTGGTPGTSIAVKNLFFNTPARRKFLRADSTEYRHILGVINRFTLAFPDIGFTLINGEQEVFSLKPTLPEIRVGDVLGSRVRKGLLPIREETTLAKITGFLGMWDLLRKSRGDQFLFVNKRYVVDRTLGFAVVSAYGETIPKGSYPIYVIYIDIDPKRIDVNVHPSKTEIKFADQRLMYDMMRGAVQKALRTDRLIPDLREREGFPLHPFSQKQPSTSEQSRFDFSAPPVTDTIPGVTQPFQSEHDIDTIPLPFSPFHVVGKEKVEKGEHLETVSVWQVHNKYIMSQIKSGLVIIDQHIAHERILYEEAKKRLAQRNPASQQLLFPHTIDLSAEDHDYLMQILPFLEKLGFVVKGFGGKTVVVEGVPSGLKVGGEEKILTDIIDEFKKNRGKDVEIQEKVLKSYACRSAVMAGERLSTETMQYLIDKLFATENPYFCPHGRPILINITLEEIDKRFQR
jgi:DNA mismatch repair protein MutL